MTHRTFEENQRYNQIWLWAIILGVSVVIFYQLVNTLIHALENNLISTGTILMSVFLVVMLAGINGLVFAMRLNTKIDQDAVQITFKPLINKPKIFRWDDIEKATVKKYNPISDFGGWGIRAGWKSKAYNTSGNKGLELLLKTGNKILIGTQRPEELEAFLKKYIFTQNEP